MTHFGAFVRGEWRSDPNWTIDVSDKFSGETVATVGHDRTA